MVHPPVPPDRFWFPSGKEAGINLDSVRVVAFDAEDPNVIFVFFLEGPLCYWRWVDTGVTEVLDRKEKIRWCIHKEVFKFGCHKGKRKFSWWYTCNFLLFLPFSCAMTVAHGKEAQFWQSEPSLSCANYRTHGRALCHCVARWRRILFFDGCPWHMVKVLLYVRHMAHGKSRLRQKPFCRASYVVGGRRQKLSSYAVGTHDRGVVSRKD